jgi:hypothetical protein
MAPASVAISLAFRVIPPPRLVRGRARPWSIRASKDTSGVAGGELKAGALERSVGDLRALVASVPPAVASVTAPPSRLGIFFFFWLENVEHVNDVEEC